MTWPSVFSLSSVGNSQPHRFTGTWEMGDVRVSQSFKKLKGTLKVFRVLHPNVPSHRKYRCGLMVSCRISGQMLIRP